MRICYTDLIYKTRSLMKFPRRINQILARIEDRGHEVTHFSIKPCLGTTVNPYLSYGIGVTSLVRSVRGDVNVFLADMVEAGAFSYVNKKLHGRPFVFDYIDDYSKLAVYGGERFRLRYTIWLEKKLPTLADHVIVNREGFKKRTATWGIPEDKVTLIHDGVDIHLFSPQAKDFEVRELYGLATDPTVLFVGKLEAYYLLETVVRAAEIVLKERSDAKFLLVGDGRAVPNLRNLAVNLGIEKAVIFTGFQPYDKVPSFIRMADVTVFTHTEGLAVYEYMACGKPIVKPRDRSGEILKHLHSALLLDDLNPKDLAEGILYVLGDRGLASKMGKNARRLAVEKYDWEILVDKYIEVIQNVSII